MTHFIFSGNIPNEEAGELKNEDKAIIILVELTAYCKKYNTDSIRYSELKDLSDATLNKFTGGFQTNFGGSFEIYIKKYEKEGYLTRIRKSPKRTLIIPNISRIENLLDKKWLKNSFDKMNIKSVHSLDIQGLQIRGGFLIPDNFPSHSIKHIPRNDDGGSISLLSIPWKIYTACDDNKNFQLSEKTIQELLAIGKTIASKDRTRPFKIILEYNGST